MRTFALAVCVTSAACAATQEVPLDGAWAQGSLSAGADVGADAVAMTLTLVKPFEAGGACLVMPAGTSVFVDGTDTELPEAARGGPVGDARCSGTIVAPVLSVPLETDAGALAHIGLSNGLTGAARVELGFDVGGAFSARTATPAGPLTAGASASLAWAPATDAVRFVTATVAGTDWGARAGDGAVTVDVPAGQPPGAVQIDITASVAVATGSCAVASCAYKFASALTVTAAATVQ